jgi:hypothetical protein
MRYEALEEPHPVRPLSSGSPVRCCAFGREPGVTELLGDPIARALMAADKTDRESVFALLKTVGRCRAK